MFPSSTESERCIVFFILALFATVSHPSADVSTEMFLICCACVPLCAHPVAIDIAANDAATAVKSLVIILSVCFLQNYGWQRHTGKSETPSADAESPVYILGFDVIASI